MVEKKHFYPVLLFGLKTASNDLRVSMTALKPNYIKEGIKFYQFEEIVWKKKHFDPFLLFGLKMASNDLRGCMTALKAKVHYRYIILSIWRNCVKKRCSFARFCYLASKRPLMTSEVLWRPWRSNYIKEGIKSINLKRFGEKRSSFIRFCYLASKRPLMTSEVGFDLTRSL